MYCATLCLILTPQTLNLASDSKISVGTLPLCELGSLSIPDDLVSLRP
jgi:hypothetical protein